MFLWGFGFWSFWKSHGLAGECKSIGQDKACEMVI